MFSALLETPWPLPPFPPPSEWLAAPGCEVMHRTWEFQAQTLVNGADLGVQRPRAPTR